MNPEIASAIATNVKPSKKVLKAVKVLREAVQLELVQRNLYAITGSLPRVNYGSRTVSVKVKGKTQEFQRPILRHPTKKVARSNKALRLNQAIIQIQIRMVNARSEGSKLYNKLNNHDKVVAQMLLRHMP